MRVNATVTNDTLRPALTVDSKNEVLLGRLVARVRKSSEQLLARVLVSSKSTLI